MSSRQTPSRTGSFRSSRPEPSIPGRDESLRSLRPEPSASRSSMSQSKRPSSSSRPVVHTSPAAPTAPASRFKHSAPKASERAPDSDSDSDTCGMWENPWYPKGHKTFGFTDGPVMTIYIARYHLREPWDKLARAMGWRSDNESYWTYRYRL